MTWSPSLTPESTSCATGIIVRDCSEPSGSIFAIDSGRTSPSLKCVGGGLEIVDPPLRLSELFAAYGQVAFSEEKGVVASAAEEG